MTRALLVLLAGCSLGPQRSSRAPSAPEATAGAAPGKGAAYSMREPTANLEAAAVPFAGSCAFAKPPGELGDYDKEARVEPMTSVFASPHFADGAANHIGKLREGVSARVAGPVARGAGGIAGYAVLVSDTSGRVCRGYVSASSVTL